MSLVAFSTLFDLIGQPPADHPIIDVSAPPTRQASRKVLSLAFGQATIARKITLAVEMR